MEAAGRGGRRSRSRGERARESTREDGTGTDTAPAGGARERRPGEQRRLGRDGGGCGHRSRQERPCVPQRLTPALSRPAWPLASWLSHFNISHVKLHRKPQAVGPA